MKNTTALKNLLNFKAHYYPVAKGCYKPATVSKYPIYFAENCYLAIPRQVSVLTPRLGSSRRTQRCSWT